MESTESPQSSPEKRRRKIPEKFRDHEVQNLPDESNIKPEIPAAQDECEPEAPFTPVSEDVEKDAADFSATEQRTDEVPVKKRRGRPPKIRMDMNSDQVIFRLCEVERIPSAFESEKKIIYRID
jgi:hypothetical protein